jgi:hypothetical protein
MAARRRVSAPVKVTRCANDLAGAVYVASDPPSGVMARIKPSHSSLTLNENHNCNARPRGSYRAVPVVLRRIVAPRRSQERRARAFGCTRARAENIEKKTGNTARSRPPNVSGTAGLLIVQRVVQPTSAQLPSRLGLSQVRCCSGRQSVPD